jgi:uncharacterized membrane protein SpoIIM required for sporulation
LKLRSADFRREREAQWSALEELLAQVERRGLGSLDPDELQRLPALYRAAISSLSVARAISLDRALLGYLESLAARAYFCVYGVRPRARAAARDFLLRVFPRSVRALAPGIVLALVALGAGLVVGLAVDDPDTYQLVVPDALAQGRTYTTTTEALRAVLYDDTVGDAEGLGVFASYLFTHNAKIGLLIFALGFALGLPSLLLLFYNGLILGAMGGLYASRGLAFDFWGWILPHGVSELLAVGLCGGAGFALALALVRPGRFGRLHALGQAGRQAGLLVLGAVGMLLLAGLIEGFLRQLVHDPAARYALAGASLLFWSAYLGFVGRGRPRLAGERRRRPREESQESVTEEPA